MNTKKKIRAGAPYRVLPSGKMVLYAGTLKVHELYLSGACGKERRASISLVTFPKDSKKFFSHIKMGIYPSFFFKANPLQVHGVIVKRGIHVNENVDFSIINFDIMGMFTIKGKKA